MPTKEPKNILRTVTRWVTEHKVLVFHEEAKLREVSFLEHEIKEIEDAKLIAGEDEELEKEYKRLSNGRKKIEDV